MKLGFLTASLCDDPGEAISKAAELGVAGLEVYCGNENDARRLIGADNASQLKQRASDAGMEIPSLCLAFVCRSPSLIDTPQESQAAKDLLIRGMDAAKTLGAGTIVLPFFGNNAIEVDSEIDKAVAALEDLVEPAQQAGIRIGIESTLSFGRHKYLLSHFEYTDVVKVYWDTGNAKARKMDLPTGIRDLGLGVIAGIHYKDVKTTEGQPPEFNVRMGEGDVDFRATTQALKAVGYDGWIILETPRGDDPIASAKANLAYAKNLLST